MFYPEVHIMSLTPPITIRPVSTADSQALLDIYHPYVEYTAITFEYEVPTAEEFTRRIRHTLKRYPYLAAEKDGQLLGYAYAGPFHERAAYDWCAEVSIYIRTDARGTGIGKKLYEALKHALTAQNILNLYACIAWPDKEDEYLTRNSADFHRHLGYELAGMFKNCGYKFDRWYSMIWMEKQLGPHSGHAEPIIPFQELLHRMPV